MNIGTGLRIILQLSSGMAYAYHEGFEHGKLTLNDIFFSADGHAVINNFGITATIEALKQSGAQSSPLAPPAFGGAFFTRINPSLVLTRIMPTLLPADRLSQ